MRISPNSRKIAFVEKDTNAVMGLSDMGKLERTGIYKCYYCMHKNQFLPEDYMKKEITPSECEFYSRVNLEIIRVDTKDNSIFEKLNGAKYQCEVCDTTFTLKIDSIPGNKLLEKTIDGVIYCNICGNVCKRV